MINLIIEDGTNVTDANTYVDIAFVDTVAELHDEQNWLDCPTEDKNKFIVKSTNLVESLYGHRYRGDILTDSQSLLYPRGSFMDGHGRLINSETIPQPLKQAVAQGAIGFANDNLQFVEEDFEDANIKRESFSAGSYSESIEYFEKQNQTSASKDRIVKELAPILMLPSRQFNVERG